MKIITIIGARPQFIKAGTVSREISKRDKIQETIIHTGQHFDENMSDIFFSQMKIPKPDYNLEINGLLHGAMTGQMLEKIERILLDETPDMVMVYGDTNSTLAGALAAAKLNITISHIESGLRSFNMHMPEEVNRILTDRISDLLFCPTDTAIKNLAAEGFENMNTKVIKSGDVMQDSAIFYAPLSEKIDYAIDGEYALSTIHRAENTDDTDRLTNIIDALNIIADSTQIILPLHPRTRKIIEDIGIKIRFDTIEPVGYLQMVGLIKNCKCVITDSGGLQKEAFFFAKPCITLRDETEWTELVDNNYNILAGANKDAILRAYMEHHFNDDFNASLYGNGQAAENIVNEIEAHYSSIG